MKHAIANDIWTNMVSGKIGQRSKIINYVNSDKKLRQ